MQYSQPTCADNTGSKRGTEQLKQQEDLTTHMWNGDSYPAKLRGPVHNDRVGQGCREPHQGRDVDRPTRSLGLCAVFGGGEVALRGQKRTPWVRPVDLHTTVGQPWDRACKKEHSTHSYSRLGRGGGVSSPCRTLLKSASSDGCNKTTWTSACKARIYQRATGGHDSGVTHRKGAELPVNFDK